MASLNPSVPLENMLGIELSYINNLNLDWRIEVILAQTEQISRIMGETVPGVDVSEGQILLLEHVTSTGHRLS
jgi:hypothetical protein